jgi:hypothetical protein
MVEYVSGLSDEPERRCKPPGKNQTYAVQRKRFEEICDVMRVEPSVDAFSIPDSARLDRWWGPGSPEAANAFGQSWGEEILWANPPFYLLHKVLAKVLREGAHAVVILPEWRQTRFLTWKNGLRCGSCNSPAPTGFLSFMAVHYRACRGTC